MLDFTTSIVDTLVDSILPAALADASIANTFCAITGFAVGTHNAQTVEQAIRHAAYSFGFDKWGDSLEAPTAAQIADMESRVMEHLTQRNLLLSRPSLALSYNANHSATAHLSVNYQLAILGNAFLWDTGTIRDEAKSLENRLWRLQSAIDFGNLVADELDAAKQEVLALLIELDAKYSIQKLEFRRTEKAKWESLRVADAMDKPEFFLALADLLAAMIRFRDEHAPVEYAPKRWSQEAMLANTVNASARAEYSNVLEPFLSHKSRKPSGSTTKPKESKAPAAAKSAIGDFLAAFKF